MSKLDIIIIEIYMKYYLLVNLVDLIKIKQMATELPEATVLIQTQLLFINVGAISAY